MRIGIDARMYGLGFGLARYIEQLVKYLQETDTENDYVLFLKKENFGLVEISNSRFRKVLADIPWYSWNEQVLFPRIIKKEKVELMHFPHWNVPLFYNDPFVVTIHDLIMFKFPRAEATTLGPIKFWIKDQVHRIVVRHAVDKSRHILVTSEFTKADINKTLHTPLNKMTVAYQVPFKSDKAVGIEDSKSVLKKYNIDKPYALYVGSAYPHKNLDGLLRAWKLFGEKNGHEYKLVLVGKHSHFYERLFKSKEWQEVKGSVVFTGLLSDFDLCAVYKSAGVYVFPSFYEGFGLPPLEAMSYGVPVVSSNFACLPEVLGEAALYFDPENPEQMAEMIYKGLKDRDIILELKQKSAEELRSYTVANFIQKAIEVYKRAI